MVPDRGSAQGRRHARLGRRDAHSPDADRVGASVAGRDAAIRRRAATAGRGAAATAEATPPPGAPPPLPPAWQPPPADHGRAASLIFGVIILVIGLWFFATQTLGLDLPRLDWRQLWPVILIVLGIWSSSRSFGRAR